MNEKYMQMAIDVAKLTKGFHLPNPAVGAVIIKNDAVIGLGYHEKFGQEHAEINAINDAEKNKQSLEDSTIYVTLSPCTKVGKTPACIQAIIDNGISKVVFGYLDPSDQNIIKILKKNKIEFEQGILEEESKYLVKNFIKNQENEMFITLKSAITIDGYIATSEGDSKWITTEAMRKFSRKKRSEAQGIVVGVNTVNIDNPMLTSKSEGYMNPDVIIIDPDGAVDYKVDLFNVENRRVFIFTNYPTDNTNNIIFLKFREDMRENMSTLYKEGIKSILVEGGSYTVNSFIKENLFHEIEVYIGSKILGDKSGKSAFDFQQAQFISESLEVKIIENKVIDDCIYIKYGRK